MDLNLLWFILLGVLLAGYAILDGFDLGVGILHLAARGDRERRIMLNAIGPVWDGNEVWLITFGGALFAAFRHAYATAFSAFYLPFMLLLFALIFRAVSIELRSKFESRAWRRFFDGSFFVGSALATLLFGIAAGNLLRGIPVDEHMEYVGGLFNLLTPFALLVGLLAVALFALHGALYMCLKAEGELLQRVYRWVWPCFGVYCGLYVITSVVALLTVPAATGNLRQHPWLVLVAALNVLALVGIAWAVHRRHALDAFLSSSVSIATLVFLFFAAVYPNLIISSLNADWSLTIYNAAASQKTLGIMTLIAALGMPLVLGYTAVIYWVFRGKVTLGPHSY